MYCRAEMLWELLSDTIIIIAGSSSYHSIEIAVVIYTYISSVVS